MKKIDFVAIVFGLMLSIGTVWADGPTVPAVPAGSMPQATQAAGVSASAAAPAQPGGSSTLVMMLLMFGVAYFIIFRPQQKRVKETQKMLSELKHGDEIVTSSGMIGRVTGITEKVVTLEIADDVRVKMLKSQVSQIIKGQVQDLA